MVEGTEAQPGTPGGGVGFSLQVACVDCEQRCLFYLPIPLRALPSYILGPEFLVLRRRELISSS